MTTQADIGDVLERPKRAPEPVAQSPKAVHASVTPKRRAKPFDGYGSLRPKWALIIPLVALVAFWAVVFARVTAALSLGSGS